jgi:hypothetical protein
MIAMNPFALRQIFEKQRLNHEQPGVTQLELSKSGVLLEQCFPEQHFCLL